MTEGRRNREKTVTGARAPPLHAILSEVDNRKVLVVEDERNIRELVCLHLGIEYRLRVGFFSWAILTTYLSFVPGETAERVLAWGTRLRSRRWLGSGSTP